MSLVLISACAGVEEGAVSVPGQDFQTRGRVLSRFAKAGSFDHLLSHFPKGIIVRHGRKLRMQLPLKTLGNLFEAELSSSLKKSECQNAKESRRTSSSLCPGMLRNRVTSST